VKKGKTLSIKKVTLRNLDDSSLDALAAGCPTCNGVNTCQTACLYGATCNTVCSTLCKC
jgi:hypothetical protein